jgi:hypothetical protein
MKLTMLMCRAELRRYEGGWDRLRLEALILCT